MESAKLVVDVPPEFGVERGVISPNFTMFYGVSKKHLVHHMRTISKSGWDRTEHLVFQKRVKWVGLK